MIKYFNATLALALFCLSLPCSGQLRVQPGNKQITYIGRVAVAEDSATFYWPGSSATINFTGTGVKATLRSLREEGFFYAIVDNDASKAFKFGSDSIRKTVSLVSGLPRGKHSLQLYKLSNNTSANIFSSRTKKRRVIPIKGSNRRWQMC
ncbi:hypothetical protein V9K67_15745 [Paraflavisolibacter sp. H34]|uniref:hypothetical protein n=1 Tax=Huijunlia imazamoxiresistens TaxID=3127457 RepID=UPI003016D477